ncbi:MAG: hypothetical protein EOP04_04540 [Proteobacteria bacterium]|nr:MAG: hypothetical protein EOP04_04540 [Pseudomonadota bacterium]
MAFSLSKVKKGKVATPPVDLPPKRAHMPWQDRDGSGIPYIEENLTRPSQVEAEVESKVKSEAESKARSEAESKARSEAESKARSEAESKARSKSSKSLTDLMYLSDSCRYTLLNSSERAVIILIAQMCISSESLVTSWESYDWLSERAKLNKHTLKRIVQTMQKNNILIIRDDYYQPGSKGRVFEITPRALKCVLTNEIRLKRWISSRSQTLQSVKKAFGFE